MRLSLRRLQPGAVFATFLGILDIKLGCEIILLFGLIHKVAGVYGLITVLVGGTFVQFLFYAYSVATLFAFIWALGQVRSESAHKTLLVAHLYALDFAILQVFHYIFYYIYWFITAHDGKRVLNSQAQKDIFELADSRGEVTKPQAGESDTGEFQSALALEIWQKEKVYAIGVVFVGLLLKAYFIMVLYSYAAHLRTSNYHSLPLTTHHSAPTDMDTSVGERDEIAAAEADLARMSSPPRSPVRGQHARSPVANGTAGSSGAAGKGKAKGKGKDTGKAADDDDDFSWD